MTPHRAQYHNPEMMTWTETKSWTRNWLSHPGAPETVVFYAKKKNQTPDLYTVSNSAISGLKSESRKMHFLRVQVPRAILPLSCMQPCVFPLHRIKSGVICFKCVHSFGKLPYLEFCKYICITHSWKNQTSPCSAKLCCISWIISLTNFLSEKEF